jgi:hypothetical protein
MPDEGQNEDVEEGNEKDDEDDKNEKNEKGDEDDDDNELYNKDDNDGIDEAEILRAARGVDGNQEIGAVRAEQKCIRVEEKHGKQTKV